MSRRFPALVLVLWAWAAPLRAQADRNGALGRVDFPTSAHSRAARAAFIRGVLLLHSFEYGDAEAEFRRARAIEPEFAMAAWGEAMTQNHPIWNERNARAAREALEKLAPTEAARRAKAPTAREKRLLRAVEILYAEGEKRERDRAYADAMREIHEELPKDDEVTLFYALALLGTCEGERDVSVYEKAGALAMEVFARRPDHPGAAHYVIHSFDDPAHAGRALPAARAYAKIAPAAPHALHMPSHIFLALGMWDDVIASNSASWKASHDTSYHALQWLQYADLQEEKLADARAALAAMREAAKEDHSPRAGMHLALMRAAELVETNGADPETLAIAVDSDGLSPSARASDVFATGFAAVRGGQRDRARESAAALDALAGKEGDSGEDAVRTGILRDELRAAILSAEGDHDRAIALLADASEREARMPYGFGPPDPVKPARELLGEALLAAGRKDEARRAFEAELVRAPKRRLSLIGLEHASS